MSANPVRLSNARVQIRKLRVSPIASLRPGRRQQRRYPITAKAEYIVDGNRGWAATADISSGGVFLKTETTLPVLKRIKVLIDWPVKLEERFPLRLVIHGKVLRSDARGTAVEIINFDFHLRPRSADLFVA